MGERAPAGAARVPMDLVEITEPGADGKSVEITRPGFRTARRRLPAVLSRLDERDARRIVADRYAYACEKIGSVAGASAGGETVDGGAGTNDGGVRARIEHAGTISAIVALGINDVAGQIREAEQSSLARDLDRPAPFTKRGMFVSRASKRQLVGLVGFKTAQASYLELQATGGKRRAKGKAEIAPVGQQLNKYDNMSRGALKRTLAKPDVFSGTVKGIAWIWQRPKRSRRRTKSGGVQSGRTATVGKRKGLKMLAIYKDSVNYSPRLKFVPRAHVNASHEIGPAIARHLAQAIKTAR